MESTRAMIRCEKHARVGLVNGRTTKTVKSAAMLLDSIV